MFLDSTSTMKFGARPYKFLLDHFYLYDFSISKVTTSLKVNKFGCIICKNTLINAFFFSMLICITFTEIHFQSFYP